MKKIFFMALAFMATLSMSAQEAQVQVASAEQTGNAAVQTETVAPSAKSDLKPGANRFTVELGINPINSVGLENGRLTGLYSFSDNVSLRLGFGFGIASERQEDEDADAFEKTTDGVFTIVPGVVFSFDGTNRLTPYVGAEVLFAHGAEKSVEENGPDRVETKTTHNTIGVNAFTGLNIYLVKDFFVGVECGLGFSHTGYEDNRSENAFGVYAQPAIRLGYLF